MGMLQLQQPEKYIITIADTYTHGTHTVTEDPKNIPVGAKSHTLSPDIVWIIPTQPPAFKWVPIPKGDRSVEKRKMKERKICTEETQYDTSEKMKRKPLY